MKASWTAEEIAQAVDHTLLRPDATSQDIKQICDEARQAGFAAVCVNSSWIALAAQQLIGCSSKPIAVVGFPLGACSTASKVYETQWVIQAGAQEVDMVIHQGHAREGNWSGVQADIAAVVKAAGQTPVKVILEMAHLVNSDAKIRAALCARDAGAAFVKTSTGFGSGGATVADVQLLRETVGTQMGVKASGGVRTFQDAVAMLDAGANRLGTSNGLAIIKNTIGTKGY